MNFSRFIPAIVSFIISFILFTLSPSNLPEDEILNIPYRDKLIHFTIFFVLVYLFAKPIAASPIINSKKVSWFLSIALYGVVYGIAVEFIQKYFVPNRSYEVWDIVADSIGCFASYFFCRYVLLKKRA